MGEPALAQGRAGSGSQAEEFRGAFPAQWTKGPERRVTAQALLGPQMTRQPRAAGSMENSPIVLVGIERAPGGRGRPLGSGVLSSAEHSEQFPMPTFCFYSLPSLHRRKKSPKYIRRLGIVIPDFSFTLGFSSPQDRDHFYQEHQNAENK